MDADLLQEAEEFCGNFGSNKVAAGLDHKSSALSLTVFVPYVVAGWGLLS
jgi:hypothetical protein